MSEIENRAYSWMIANVRRRHNLHDGGWPGMSESSPATTYYPNILAELDGSGFWLERMEEFGGASGEIMAAAMEDNEILSRLELRELTRCFGCKVGYLSAPVLQMVDPSTNKGKIRRQFLADLVMQTDGMDRFMYDLKHSDVLEDLKAGRPVTYASYRWACHHLQVVLDRESRIGKRSLRTRRERRTCQKESAA